jgi:hypothetical protein
MKKLTLIFAIWIYLSISSLLIAQSETTNWPQFRGPQARGISENSSIPAKWDVETGDNVKWKTKVPGLGFSCPVIWENKLFLTTAISGIEDPEVKVGLYGDIEPVDDETIHTWKVLCYDKKSGELTWEQTAHTGVPKVKRHPKSTQIPQSLPMENMSLLFLVQRVFIVMILMEN